MNFTKLILITTLTILASFNVQAQLTTGTVDFDVNTLHSMEQVTVNLSDGSSLILVREYVVDKLPGRYAWIGHVVSENGSRVVISVRGTSAAGLIQTASRVWNIELAENISEPVRELDPTVFPKEADPIEVPYFSDSFEGEDSDKQAAAAAMATCDDPPSEIDVMVLYTDDAAAKSFNIETKIDKAVDLANSSYDLTKIVPNAPGGPTLRLNLVYTQKVQIEENSSSDFSSELKKFKSNGDGYLDEVHDLRNQYNADLVVLLVATGENCGRAEIDGAFSVVEIGCISNHTFTHELGHNFGAMHDKYALLLYNPFKSNYGYSNIPTNDDFGWRTIMAYPNECDDKGPGCLRKLFFSSPDNTDSNGNPTGNSGTDNRKQLVNAAGTVACYKDADFYPTNIAVDGNPDDWLGATPLLSDAVGNPPPTEYRTTPNDFIKLYVSNDNNFVYFLFEFEDAISDVERSNIMANLTIDADRSTETGCSYVADDGQSVGAEFGLVLRTRYGDPSTSSFLGDIRDCSSSSSDFPGAVTAAKNGRFFEASIPLNILSTLAPEITALSFYGSTPYIGDGVSNVSYVLRYWLRF